MSKLKELYLYSGVTIINGAETSFGSADDFVGTLRSVLTKSRFSDTTEMAYFDDADEDIIDEVAEVVDGNPDTPDFIFPMVLRDEDDMNDVIDKLNEYYDQYGFEAHYFFLILTDDVTAGEREKHIDISDLRERFDLYLNV